MTVGGAVVALLACLLAAGAYAAWALVMAGRLRAELTLALANLVYLVGLVAGGVIWPVAAYPPAVQAVVAASPTGALGEALRAASLGGAAWRSLLVLLLWGAVGALLARKVFRWMS